MRDDETVLVRNCRFAFRCHQQWAALERTPDARVRYCHECAQDVHLCRNDRELRAAVVADRCVAVVAPAEYELPPLVGLAMPWSR